MADLGPVQGTLGEAFQRIAEMLKRANLQDSGTFSVDADGFAVVTPVESITETEEPRQDPGRFSYDEAGRIQSGHFLEVLFNRKPGRYRTFTIVVTPLDLTRGAKSRWSEAREHYSEGAAQLPPTLANLNVSPGTRMTILIYEFERPAPDDQEPIFVPRSRISAKDQIVKAGLLPPDALR